MLDFLNEQQDDDLKNTKSNIAEKKSVSDGDKEQKKDEYFTVGTQGKKLQKSSILLAVLFGIGLLCLLFMIKRGTPQLIEAAVVNDEEEKIDMVIARLGGVRTEVSTRIDKIINKFYEFSNTAQISVDELIKNPFKFDRSWQGWDSDSTNLSMLIQDYNIENMQLLSVMRSGKNDARWCCMIDDKILYEGDSIKGFKVCEINENFVRLESAEGKLVLRLTND